MVWITSKNDDDFREHVDRGKLKRAEIGWELDPSFHF